jgi:hypothetical protein
MFTPAICIDVSGTDFQHAVEYVLLKTTAPKDYDAFGTITLYDGLDGPYEALNCRYVLQPLEHITYFVERGRSGLYQSEQSDAMSASEIWRRLYERIVLPSSKE